MPGQWKLDTRPVKLDACSDTNLATHHWRSILYLSGYTESPLIGPCAKDKEQAELGLSAFSLFLLWTGCYPRPPDLKPGSGIKHSCFWIALRFISGPFQNFDLSVFPSIVTRAPVQAEQEQSEPKMLPPPCFIKIIYRIMSKSFYVRHLSVGFR